MRSDDPEPQTVRELKKAVKREWRKKSTRQYLLIDRVYATPGRSCVTGFWIGITDIDFVVT